MGPTVSSLQFLPLLFSEICHRWTGLVALLEPALFNSAVAFLDAGNFPEASKARRKLENLVRWGGGQDINHVEASLGAHS